MICKGCQCCFTPRGRKDTLYCTSSCRAKARNTRYKAKDPEAYRTLYRTYNRKYRKENLDQVRERDKLRARKRDREHVNAQHRKYYWEKVYNQEKPKTREDCRSSIRPCPFISCRYHLLIDIRPKTGNIQFHKQKQAIYRLKHSCALDIAERGPHTFSEIGEIMGFTTQRIEQISQEAMQKLQTRASFLC